MDLVVERTKLLARDHEWAVVASDVDAILSCWTDDAVVLPPGLPAVTGKTALREYIRSSSRQADYGMADTDNKRGGATDRRGHANTNGARAQKI